MPFMKAMEYLFIYAGVGLFVLFLILIALLFRTVVPTDQVHIVQSRKKTTSYGRDQGAGNTYYKWPSWIPIIGVVTKVLPVSIFSINLTNYPAYDKNRLPFTLDIAAFFRVKDPSMASERVESQDELDTQLHAILQGSVRSILAKHDIETILEGRSEFGDAFTKEVDTQLEQWGVHTVKTIELMDLRDGEGSKIILNIMAKESSRIDRESRIQVADNKRQAQTSEIEAQREVSLRQQEAEERVGQRTAEKEKNVGIANEQSKQEVQAQAKVTQEREMEVARVKNVKAAEIQREVEIVQADQERQKIVIASEAAKEQAVIGANAEKEQTIVNAEGEARQRVLAAAAQKESTELIAAGDLRKALNHAEGVLAEGTSIAESERLKQLATVTAQVTLADKIADSAAYQTYLVSIEQVAAARDVGIEQAKALQTLNQNADIKMIINTGEGGTQSGMKSLMDIFTPKGGTTLGAAVEAFAQTPTGEALLSKVLPEKTDTKDVNLKKTFKNV